MYGPLTSRFLQTVASSYDMLTVIDLYRGDVILTDEDDPLRVVAGEVDCNAADPIRRTLRARFVDKTGALTPVLSNDLLMPNGVEAVVRTGPVYPDGTQELIPVGRFRITNTSSRDGLVDVRGFDLAWRVQTPMTQPYRIPAGVEVGQAIADMIQAKDPTVEVNMATTSCFTNPGVVDLQDDPWGVARSMAASAGCDLFFDSGGVMVMTPKEASSGDPALKFTEGENATFWNPEREITAESTPSVIVVEANHSSLTSPLRVTVRDEDPNSLTYADGPYGEVTRFITSDKISTQAQARDMGQSEMAARAWVEIFSFSCIPNPAILENDQITITREKMRLVEAPCVVDQFTIPLVPGSMSVTAKTRRDDLQSGILPD